MRDNNYHSVKPLLDNKRPQVYIETYGCQMNVNDSEVVLSILQKAGYSLCPNIEDANLILVNTCSIRDNAEQRILGRLDVFRLEKKKRTNVKVGILGCMAERLKDELLSNPAVDIVAGPDSYRDLPRLIASLSSGEKQINTILSQEETYADISPVRMDQNGVSAYISIMRGCNNVCSYCVVPYVRGAERSRDPKSIIHEAKELFKNGYKEINLLGQNVDSYLWVDPSNPTKKVNFAQLLELVALISPKMRVRFSTSHPKDMGNGVLYTMAMYPNICNHIHLPVQSGSNAMLEKMNRKYTREGYLERVAKIHEILPDCSITTDVIAGFCSETDRDHQDTISLFKEVRFDNAFMFQYSERPNTKAARKFKDDIPPEVKTARLNEIIALQNAISLENNQKTIGQKYEVLIEGASKRSDEELMGRIPQNKACVFPAKGHKAGEYVTVRINSCTSATLIGEIIEEEHKSLLDKIL
ncbi:MAG: tRNA (N6-isopentenyl adenosine(37)-C2)-methylthiotransferase MiaB [Bacteroidales bacterium]|nr:tRNA (N6-isopentenyl adenosine(37)-C2)-methylthiotransferase MiaB [Bacteroidales bacterium]MDD4669805.1 tRNA (N6-isopentenyl adenosine(37)-C2)-methylthiotransferase MiaB [Bacteroidales bacterium]